MHKAGSQGPAVQSGAAGATPGGAAGEPLTVPSEQAETRGRIRDPASGGCSLEWAQEHTASKADVEKAGNRLIIPGAAAAISIPAALFSASRLFLLPRGGCRARVQTSSVRGLSRGHCEQAEHGVRRRGEAVIAATAADAGPTANAPPPATVRAPAFSFSPSSASPGSHGAVTPPLPAAPKGLSGFSSGSPSATVRTPSVSEASSASRILHVDFASW